MSPAKSKKAKSAPRKASKKAGKSARSSKKASRPKAVKAPKPAKGRSAKPTASATGHAPCAATDPFGDDCQNLPRRPSKYCVIHSYLDR